MNKENIIKIYEKNGRRLTIITVVASVLLSGVISYTLGHYIGSKKAHAVEISAYEPETWAINLDEEPIEEPVEPEKIEAPASEEKVMELENPLTTEEEIDLISLVVMAEAEGECEEGQRLVIDTILNRVDHGRFPDTIHGVLYQPNQFEPMWNGRINRCYVQEDIRNLVLEELQTRTNSEVIFFRTTRYSDYGTPLFQVGNHYFSKY